MWKWKFRLLLLQRFPILSSPTNSSLPFSYYSRRGIRPGISDGLNWALAGKGVMVMDKAFRNLTPSELRQKGNRHQDFHFMLEEVFLDGCQKFPKHNLVSFYSSPSAGNILGLGAQGNNGFIVADVERSSLILCGKAFCDVKGTKEALCSLSGPIISSRGGLPLSAGLLVSANSVVLSFAPEATTQSCSDLLVSRDGVILSSEGVSPLFQSGISGKSYLSKLPDAIIFVSFDCSGTIPSASRLSPGQAAFHFLAGYQNGTFLPAYSKDHLPINPLELAKAFLSKVDKFIWILLPGYLGKDLIELVLSTISNNVPPFEPKGGDLQGKYETFLSSKFPELPDEFSF